MVHTVWIKNLGLAVQAADGADLLDVLRHEGLAPEAPCGGRGKCKKCAVTVDGTEQLACRTVVSGDMAVTLPEKSGRASVLISGCGVPAEMDPFRPGYLLAFDIGTTTIVCYLLDESGTELAAAGMLNPQAPFGADVISRIQHALGGAMERLTDCIRGGLEKLTVQVCQMAGVPAERIGVVSVVGNPCMQQLFLGITPQNLASVPFAPVITESSVCPARDILPIWENAVLLTVPDISGYVGADTVGCVLATRMHEDARLTLMVDIGTNGEMVLGNQAHMVACSTAAGPALEGAGIKFGMHGAPGAIDHVWISGGALCVSVIGGGPAKGVCGSGLIDAIACFLELGLVDMRGRLLASSDLIDGERVVHLTDTIYITQNDIREVQMAKGAIAAGVVLMANQLGTSVSEIDRVLLAGAFGSFLQPESVCRIGLLPAELLGKIQAVGNAAGSGAKLAACSRREFARTDELVKKIQFLELASLPDFRHKFAMNMRFYSQHT